jgi:hypothetical protein
MSLNGDSLDRRSEARDVGQAFADSQKKPDMPAAPMTLHSW